MNPYTPSSMNCIRWNAPQPSRNEAAAHYPHIGVLTAPKGFIRLVQPASTFAMTLDFAFSESIGSLITDGKHPPIHALACPLQVKCIYKRSTSQPAMKLLNA
tara:strand:- start:710 stop:1015 length:306 start_codon:yes stop_codon:yes gene_type:complete